MKLKIRNKLNKRLKTNNNKSKKIKININIGLVNFIYISKKLMNKDRQLIINSRPNSSKLRIRSHMKIQF